MGDSLVATSTYHLTGTQNNTYTVLVPGGVEGQTVTLLGVQTDNTPIYVYYTNATGNYDQLQNIGSSYSAIPVVLRSDTKEILVLIGSGVTSADVTLFFNVS